MGLEIAQGAVDLGVAGLQRIDLGRRRRLLLLDLGPLGRRIARVRDA